jgi:hypothetical protein
VRVPETAVDEDRLLSTWENDVRPPREVLAMKPVTVPEPMEEAAYRDLWASVLRLDGLHDQAPLSRSSRI